MKKIVMLLAIAGLGSVAMAQDVKTTSENKHEVLTNKFFDNWFISAGVGAEMLFGNSDTHYGIGDRISPTFNVGAGKWFTPGLGLRLQYSGYEARGAKKGAGRYAKGKPDAAGYYDQKFHYMNLHGDVLFNLNALFGGYNPYRIYEVIPYLGGGFTHSYSGITKSQGLALNGGIINKFRISSAFDVNLELSGMLAENKFDGERGGKKDFDGTLAATVGVTYYFKNRGFKKSKSCPPQLISETELNGMRHRMNALADENQNLKGRLAAAPKEVVVEGKESVKKVPDIAQHAVFFNMNSSVVSQQELINLGYMADMAKEYPSLKLKLTGYADAATGSAETNKAISLKRAEAVADALAKTYGISRNRITTDAAGGVEKFDKDYLNRMVLIEIVK